MHNKHVSKANWRPGELKKIRKMLTAKHGSGSRAQTRVMDEMVGIKQASVEDRMKWRLRLRHAS